MLRARTVLTSLALAAAVACDPTDPVTVRVRPPASHALATVNVLDVTTTSDAGNGSLRQAIADAQPGDVIHFDPAIAGQTITLTSGELSVDKVVTIEGSATQGMTISGGGNSRIATVTATGDLTLRNLTITDGLAPFGSNGGGLANRGGKLTIEHSTVTNNVVDWEGGGAEGGGIYNGDDAVLTIVNSTVSGNSSRSSGGGIVSSGILTLTHTTITNNASVGSFGGGLSARDGTLKLRNTIIVGNSAGNTAGSNKDCRVISGTSVTVLGTSLIGTDDCLTQTGIVVADPLLGPLASNGGPTKTHAILINSPAIDALATCPVLDDQRHVARPQGAACDIGAYEFTEYVTTPVAIDASVAVNSKTGVAIVTGSMACSSPVDVPLHVELSQSQKNGRSTVTAKAAGDIVVSCTSVKAWSVSVAPPTGAFLNGTGTVAVNTTPPGPWVTPSSVSAAVKLYWARK